MLSTEFDRFLNKPFFESNFLGVFSRDNYPNQLKANQFFILNKDNSSQPGSHWLACYFNGEYVEFFDSLGTNEKDVKNLLTFSKKLYCTFNETQLQPNDSFSCGQFCIYFLYKRYFGRDISMKNCLNLNFSLDLKENDLKVNKFCEEFLL